MGLCFWGIYKIAKTAVVVLVGTLKAEGNFHHASFQCWNIHD